MSDAAFMRRAIRLAKRAEGMTSPNPMVGAVLVHKGRIVAEGYHRKAGTAHAEAIALGKAGPKAAGCTLYVSLEPCCHKDKRTPPCTDKIIASGVRKVVAAMQDPNPKVSGKGLAALRAAGIEVEFGLLEESARRLNEAYIKYIRTGRPFVTLKVAMTLDGKIATPEGESKWITGERARRDVHRLRGISDALLTAIGTVRADNPELTCRTGRWSSPLRVLLDPMLEISEDAKLLNFPPRTVIIASRKAPKRKQKRLEARGTEIWLHDGKHADLSGVMQRLGDTGIMSVLIEGGSSLASSCLEAGIVDKVIFHIAPKIMGGAQSVPAVGGKFFRRLHEAHFLSETSCRRLGDDFVIEGYLKQDDERQDAAEPHLLK